MAFVEYGRRYSNNFSQSKHGVNRSLELNSQAMHIQSVVSNSE